MPDPLQEGSSNLGEAAYIFGSLSWRKKRLLYAHMSNRTELRIRRVHQQKVSVDWCYIGTSSFRKHHFEGGEAFSISFEGVQLDEDKRIQQFCNFFFGITLPLFFIRALKCDVLLPGAAVASITTLSSVAGGESTIAGKQEALSWRMILPERYSGSLLNVVCGENKRRSGTWRSLENPFLFSNNKSCKQCTFVNGGSYITWRRRMDPREWILVKQNSQWHSP